MSRRLVDQNMPEPILSPLLWLHLLNFLPWDYLYYVHTYHDADKQLQFGQGQIDQDGGALSQNYTWFFSRSHWRQRYNIYVMSTCSSCRRRFNTMIYSRCFSFINHTFFRTNYVLV